MQRSTCVRTRNVLIGSTFVTTLCIGSFGVTASPVSASDARTGQSVVVAATTAAPAPPIRAEEVSELKAQMAEMKAKLDLLESQQEQQATNSLNAIRKQAAAAAAAKARPAPGQGVHVVETSGTDVRLYGLLEATLAGITNSTSSGAPQIGMPVSWFSGNRWGIEVNQKLYQPGEGEKAPDNKLDLIAKLESEFELPSGNQDTPGVLFNRDAWIGMQSKAFGKLTIGRQDALPRDVAGIWGDPYGNAAITTSEGNFTNVNNFKQLIFYTSGGNGSGGQGDTRYDQGIVWKKVFGSGLFLSAGYNFGDANGPGGPNGSGPIPGAEFNRGSSLAGGIGYNAGRFHTTAFYNTTNVLEKPTIGAGNIGHQDQSVGFGGNYDWGIFRVNAGFINYTGEQGLLGHRYDKVWTTSARYAPSKFFDGELGVQEFYSQNAAANAEGIVLRPFTDGTAGKGTINGNRFTIYGSLIVHPLSNIDLYVAADDLLTGGAYLDSRAHGYKHVNEFASGARYKF